MKQERIRGVVMYQVTKNRPKCPRCGSENVAQIRWGRQVFNDALLDKKEKGEIILMGCFLPKDSKNWHCHDCGHEFGKTGLTELMRFNKKKKPSHIAAHAHSFVNRDEIMQSQKCGCFRCLHIFAPDAVSEWIDDLTDEPTALCPYCFTDSVIGDESGFPITEEFLKKMRDYWFDNY